MLLLQALAGGFNSCSQQALQQSLAEKVPPFG
jgi:hypothetical protein